jgi:hypothetical protein
VTAYKKSKRGRAAARRGTARYRLKHPYQKKPPKPRVTLEHKRTKMREIMRRFIAKKKGYTPVNVETIQPKPKDGCCQKCRRVADLHLDHDHATGRFRGWLCIQCNMGIGQLGDTVEGLQEAITYLKGKLPWQRNLLCL